MGYTFRDFLKRVGWFDYELTGNEYERLEETIEHSIFYKS